MRISDWSSDVCSSDLFGEYDQNLVALENRLGVYISARGNRVQIEGEAEQAARARDVLTGLYNRLTHGQPIDEGDVEGAVAMSADPSLEGVVKAAAGEAPPIMIRTRRKTIVPRSGTQIRYMESLASDDIIRSEAHTSELQSLIRLSYA